MSQDLEGVGCPTRANTRSTEAATGPTARVLRVQSEMVQLEVDTAQACSLCAIERSCAGLRLGAKPAPLILLADNRCDARPGHEVQLNLPGGGLAWSATLLYLLPALAMVVGAALGSGVGSEILGCSPDHGAIAGAGLALLTILGLLRLFDPHMGGWRRLRLEAVRVIRGEEVG